MISRFVLCSLLIAVAPSITRGQTIRVFNDRNVPLHAAVVSGEMMVNRQLPAMSWCDFDLKDDTNDRVLILRSVPVDSEDGKSAGPQRVIATKTVNPSETPSKLMVAWLRENSSVTLDMFCVGKGLLHPLDAEFASQVSKTELQNQFHASAPLLKQFVPDSRL